jgi:hypothetical protein
MLLTATKFHGIFINKRTKKVYSKRSGSLKELKQSHVYDKRKRKPKPYIQVGVPECTLLHRIIAYTFIGNADGLTVNHKNGNTLDNRIKNLEIVTLEQNLLHAKETGLLSKGESHGRSLYKDSLLLKALKRISSGFSVKSTAEKYKVSQSYLNKVKNGVYRRDLLNRV